LRETEKLRQAVELTLDSGYQLAKGAFEFLILFSETGDPADIVGKAIKKIESSNQKSFFIERSLLEELVENSQIKEEFYSPPEDPVQKEAVPRRTEGKRRFDPYAEGVEANLEVIRDPSNESSSSGAIEDYVKYFRDRFKRMERLLRQRIDVRNAISVKDALRAPANTSLKILVMITGKRESRNRILLTVEDLDTIATVLVPQNAPPKLLKEAQSLLPDQVVCLEVRKVRGTLLIAEDVILPDLAKRSQHMAPIPIYAVLTSDLHVGSTKFQKDAFSRFVLWLNGKYGNDKMREIAGHVKYVLIAGDIVDGIGVYPNQIEELTIKDVFEQYRFAGKLMEQIPDYIEVVITPGNHDASRKALPQPAIPNQFLEPLQESRKVCSLGNPCLLSLHGIEILLHHGRSLEDVLSTVPKMEHGHPERAMTLLLRSRHLAPIYGGKTPLFPEPKDLLVIEEVPDIYHSGHIHKLEHTKYRGVLVVNSGCWQEQTDYMRRHGFVPTPGQVPVVNLQTMNLTTIRFS